MPQSPLSSKNIWHIIVGGTIGNVTEWYNFLLYGYLASVISQLFFPADNQLLSLTLTFTIFALSFFARPFGGILFGWIGDQFGRKHALVCSLLMMTIPTLCIGFLPTYHDIGLASPILLCIFRMLQGLSAGGEHTGSAIYIDEHAPATRKTLWVSTVPTSAAIGVVISSASALLIIHGFSPATLLSWGWRVGYWAGALLCIISLLLRLTLPETPYFQKIQKEKRNHRVRIAVLFGDINAFKSLLFVFFLASSYGVFYQILFIWMPTYLTHIQHLSNSMSLQINTLFMIILMCFILVAGFISDYINRKFLLMLVCFAMLIFAYPLFMMLTSNALWEVYAAMGIFTIIFSVYIATSFVAMVEIFHARIRYTGLSFGFNLGLALFGGTAPLVATWLIEITQNNMMPAFYVMFFAALALLTNGLCKEQYV